MDKIVSEDEDKLQEEVTTKKALSMCGYPKWTFDKVRKRMENKQQTAPKQKDTTQKSRGILVIPYVQGLTERSIRVFKKHGISTGMKPHTSLRKILELHAANEKAISRGTNQRQRTMLFIQYTHVIDWDGAKSVTNGI